MSPENRQIPYFPKACFSLVCIFKFISCDDHISFDCLLLWLWLLWQENQLYLIRPSVLIYKNEKNKSSHILNLVDFLSFCWFVYAFSSTTVAIFLEAIKTRAWINITPFALHAYAHVRFAYGLLSNEKIPDETENADAIKKPNMIFSHSLPLHFNRLVFVDARVRI